MKRNLFGTLSLLALSLLSTTPGAYAQHAMQATMPFAFNVGSSQLPAGSYLITVDYHGDRIVVRNSGGSGATVLSYGQREAAGDKSQKLVFKRFGDQYFLTEIWGEQGNSGEAVSVPRSAAKLQVASAPTQSNKEVMIALK